MLRSTISTWREYLTPISHKSTFLSTGQITPDEFVQAGNYLVSMFPTWSWNGDISPDNISARDFLPPDKQFLVSRKVPCLIRAQDFFNVDYNDELDEEEDTPNETSADAPANSTNTNSQDNNSIQDIDEMLQSMDVEDVEDNDDEVITTHNTADQTKRYYDLYIAYSTSYRVPKMYLVGFNAHGTPLTAEEMLEDIALDYRRKTATIEKLPFLKTPVLSVSIHPCKHANVMKILLEKIRSVNERKRMESKPDEEVDNDQTTDANTDGDNDWQDLQEDVNDNLRVDQYLIVFLKFITSVTPSIQHDYTMEGW
ncbi:Atg3 protein [Maudiozyma humilis]|uniref:Autophagy-related protein 3 n=1 Tax=Maudiozyma humilis TaxID=51915 RepID=A0AAV5RXQ6_MAUHU|nr:Atg3 protein [Kazachstania humilis]